MKKLLELSLMHENMSPTCMQATLVQLYTPLWPTCSRVERYHYQLPSTIHSWTAAGRGTIQYRYSYLTSLSFNTRSCRAHHSQSTHREGGFRISCACELGEASSRHTARCGCAGRPVRLRQSAPPLCRASASAGAAFRCPGAGLQCLFYCHVI